VLDMPGTGPILLAFDLDGVLYSSEPFLGEAYRRAIANVNRARPGSFDRVPETHEILRHVGWPVPTILRRLFPDAEEAAITLLAGQTLATICRFVEERRGILYDGVAETLAALRARDFVLTVASNGRRRYVETVLTTYRLEHLFEPFVSADEVGDKIAIVRAYLDSIRPAAAIMVGDRASDVEAAEANQAIFIGCDYGHGHRSEIEGAGPIVTRFADLPAAVRAGLDRRSG
jgi:phosphoglycolate phosphatase